MQWAIVLLLAIVAPLLPGWTVFLLSVALAKALVVLGIGLLMRGGLVSFGHGMYYAAGAYGVAFAMKLMGIREALVLAVLGLVAGGLLASVLGMLLARYRGLFFAMLNLALSMMVYGALLKFYWVTGGTDGMAVRQATFGGFVPPAGLLRVAYFYLSLGVVAIVVSMAHRLVRSPMGYLLRALRDNEVRVNYMGGWVEQTIYRVYVLSGGLAGLGGSLVVLNVGHAVPDFAYWSQSGEFVFVALFGGYGHVLGPLSGSILFEFVRSYAYKVSPYTWQLLLGAMLALVILFLPEGLWSLVERRMARRDRWGWSWRPSS